MKRLGPILLLGFLVGYACNVLQNGASPSVEQAPLRPYRNGPAPPDVPPVAGPAGLPLYPPGDEPIPNKPMHWKWTDIQAIHASRAAAQRAAASGGQAPAVQYGANTFRGLEFQEQLFRTHRIILGGRQKFPRARPTGSTGIVSHYDDADQHEGTSDFYVVAGGRGKYVVDGEMQNRQYSRIGGPDRNRGGTLYPILPGEFHGLPVVNGNVYDGQLGDWLAIPPNVPHWWIPEPNEGMSYLMIKLFIGGYPSSLIDSRFPERLTD